MIFYTDRHYTMKIVRTLAIQPAVSRSRILSGRSCPPYAVSNFDIPNSYFCPFSLHRLSKLKSKLSMKLDLNPSSGVFSEDISKSNFPNDEPERIFDLSLLLELEGGNVGERGETGEFVPCAKVIVRGDDDEEGKVVERGEGDGGKSVRLDGGERGDLGGCLAEPVVGVAREEDVGRNNLKGFVGVEGSASLVKGLWGGCSEGIDRM